jgi:glucose/arabinose dehydrogenase
MPLMRLLALACAVMMAGPAFGEDGAAKPLTGKDAYGGWTTSKPGVRRLIMPNDMPPPFATEFESSRAELIERPEGAVPQLPEGFAATLIADGLERPRVIRVAPNGDIFLAESGAGAVRVIRLDKDGKVAANEVFADGFEYPYGIAFYPPGPNPTHVYIADPERVVRYPYTSGDLAATGEETVIEGIPGGGHSTRDIAFSPNGDTLYLAVGSRSNVAEGLQTLDETALKRFEESHGTGAAWNEETDRAVVLAYDPSGGNKRTFATGIRNCSGLAMKEATVWCATNERDGLGNDLPPDYVSRIAEGGFYGWPWYYIGGNPDPRHEGARPDLKDRAIVPDVLIQPHSAPLQLTFYDGTMFPAAYRGEGFASLHGSWNRGERTGYKVVRIVMRDGQPTGEYEDFMTGFLTPEGDVWGRPVGVAVGADGALLVSEDGNGTLWRVTYAGEEGPS